MVTCYLGETATLDMAMRKSAPGDFVRLRDGFTHYEIAGAGADHAVVLVCGFSVPYYIFDPTFEALRDSGRRVLRYDHFGRGWSDRPRRRYGIEFFVRQLSDLIDALGIRRVDLVALSMGGPIAARFAVERGSQVRRLVFIDPSGAGELPLPGYLRLARLPLLAELAFCLMGREPLLRAIASDFFDARLVAEFQERYRVQMLFRGFRSALLSTLRNGMLGSFVSTYEALGKLGIPTVLIWGREDRTVPLEQGRTLARLLPAASLHVIDHAGHVPHFERPELVQSILVGFLK